MTAFDTDIVQTTAKLASELALCPQVIPLQDILDRYDLTPAELRTLLSDPQIKHQVETLRREWHSDLSARERMQIKAQVSVEDLLPVMHGVAANPNLPPTARIEAFKQLVAIADAKPRPDAPDAGPKFSISINVPSAEPITIEAIDSTPDLPTLEHDG